MISQPLSRLHTILSTLAFLTTSLACDKPIRANVIHVSPQPLPHISPQQQTRTINQAVRNLRPGDQVIIHAGTYRESVLVEASGTPDAPILIQAAPAQRVIVTGADLLTDWRPEDSTDRVFSTPWPHRFIPWSPNNAHPDDDYHLLIGRCEQVFIDHYPLRQVLHRDKLSRGAFFADARQKRLYLSAPNNADLTKQQLPVEASTRDCIWHTKGAFVHLRGIRFRYAANHAQRGAVIISGNNNAISDCLFEYANSIGLAIDNATNTSVRRCTMQYNGQLGFSADHAHNLLISHCTVRDNSTKGWDHAWEAGGNKICMSRNVLIEHSRFIANRGNGIWFDIGNENATVRNCLIADNQEAGIFYEISYALHAHDNVIIGNGFDAAPAAWGASSGISLSSSPGCRIERNLLLANKEGFNYREQDRTTPRIDQPNQHVPVWNHDQILRNNVLAFNRDAQTWGWFDIHDARHWPDTMQPAAAANRRHPLNPDLHSLKLDHNNNLYFAAPNQGLFNWGPAWAFHKRYDSLDQLRKDLNLESQSAFANPGFLDFDSRDLRVPADSATIKLGAYPRGQVPDVTLGIATPNPTP